MSTDKKIQELRRQVKLDPSNMKVRRTLSQLERQVGLGKKPFCLLVLRLYGRGLWQRRIDGGTFELLGTGGENLYLLNGEERREVDLELDRIVGFTSNAINLDWKVTPYKKLGKNFPLVLTTNPFLSFQVHKSIQFRPSEDLLRHFELSPSLDLRDVVGSMFGRSHQDFPVRGKDWFGVVVRRLGLITRRTSWDLVVLSENGPVEIKPGPLEINSFPVGVVEALS